MWDALCQREGKIKKGQEMGTSVGFMNDHGLMKRERSQENLAKEGSANLVTFFLDRHTYI